MAGDERAGEGADARAFEPLAARASDWDREQAAECLKRHFSEGRLTLEEFSERLGGVYAARTHDDLRQIGLNPTGSAAKGFSLVTPPATPREQAMACPEAASQIPQRTIGAASLLVVWALVSAGILWAGEGVGIAILGPPAFVALSLILCAVSCAALALLLAGTLWLLGALWPRALARDGKRMAFSEILKHFGASWK